MLAFVVFVNFVSICQYSANRLSGMNVSEMICFVSGEMRNLNSISLLELVP